MNIEQVAALVGIAVPVIAGLDFLIRWYFDSHRKALREQIRQLKQEVESLKGQLPSPDWISPVAAVQIQQVEADRDQLRTDLATAHDEAVQARVELAKAKADRLKADQKYEAAEAERAGLALSLAQEGQRLAEVSARLEQMKAAVAAYEKGDASRAKIIKKTLALEGKVWTQDVLHGAAKFLSLPARKVPIISVLNLKGGVGKTTLASYVAWALARRGYRLLLIDLDLQGSLSSMFLSEPDLKRRDNNGRLLRHFLASAAQKSQTHLHDFTVPLPKLGCGASLLATTDKLAYEELNLTFQWLFRIGRAQHQWSGRKDVRLLLRRALHRKSLKKQYDLVLLDCPPIVNLCCANALAASDSVLVPVTPSRKALERVPPLLARLKEIHQTVNNELSILGIVANRTQYRDSMTPTETDLWNGLPQKCLDTLGQPVYRFKTFLPQRTLIRNAEDDFPPRDDADIISRVDRLALEIEERLPLFCRPAPTSAAKTLFDKKEV